MSTDAYFATILEWAPDAMLVFNDRSVIQYVNQQSECLFGYPQTELLRSPLTLLVPSGLSQLPETGAPLILRLEARHKTGRRLFVEAAVARVDFAQGPLFSASYRTRSPLLQLPAAGQSKSEFLANMSHELRSPLNVIIGFARLMYKKRVGEITDAQREYLGDILDSGQHMLELINDLVALAKLEAGKLELRPEPLSLPELLLELHESLESVARAKNIKLTLEASEAEAELEHDPKKLKQVLRNILSYALQVTPEGGSLQLQARRDKAGDDHVRLEITGASTFAAACMTHLADSELRSVLTVRLAEQLGACIGVSSEHTSMYVVLPRTAAGLTTRAPRPEST